MENPQATINLSDAIDHPLFAPALREVVLAMAERPGALSLGEVIAALGLDEGALVEQFIAEAVGAEVVRCLQADAARGLH